jgi:hypothetical protein
VGKASVKATLVAGLISVIFVFAIVFSGAPLWLRITGGAAAMAVWWRYYYVTRTKYVIAERLAREERTRDSDDLG